jgi:hypothetical protein
MFTRFDTVHVPVFKAGATVAVAFMESSTTLIVGNKFLTFFICSPTYFVAPKIDGRAACKICAAAAKIANKPGWAEIKPGVISAVAAVPIKVTIKGKYFINPPYAANSKSTCSVPVVIFSLRLSGSSII